MKQDTKELILRIIQAIGFFALGTSLWAASIETSTLRAEAVERGFAEWKVTPRGATSWHWKESAK